MTAVTLDDFSGHVGAPFAVNADGARLDLTLEKAESNGKGVREGGAFSLAFRGPVEPILPQAIYRLERGGAAHEIFIVPIASDATGTQYEAIFT